MRHYASKCAACAANGNPTTTPSAALSSVAEWSFRSSDLTNLVLGKVLRERGKVLSQLSHKQQISRDVTLS